MSCLYFIQSADAIKIGQSRFFDRRLREIQSCNPTPIKVVAVFEGKAHIEKHAHAALKEHRLNGEWFAASPAIFSLIKKIKAGEFPEIRVHSEPAFEADIIVTRKSSLICCSKKFASDFLDNLPEQVFRERFGLGEPAMRAWGHFGVPAAKRIAFARLAADHGIAVPQSFFDEVDV